MSFRIRDWTTGQLNALVKRLGDEDARRVLSEEFELRFPKSNLLTHHTTIITLAAPYFYAQEWFEVDKNVDVPISWLGDNFRKHFLDKVEEDVSEGTLTLQELDRASLDAPIIEALGGEEKAEVSLANLYAAMEHIGKPNNWVGIVSYIKDMNGVLWFVNAYWYPSVRSWYVEAFSVESPIRWFEGNLILSRDS